MSANDNIAVTISNANEQVTPLETIDAVKKAGFSNVFVEWYDKDWEISQEEQLAYCRKLGLHVLFAHLGYQKINSLWLDSEEGEALVERYQRDIKACKDNGIDLVCMHLTSKSQAPAPNEIGIRRLRAICDYAREAGVRVAFENTKIKGYQEYVLKHIQGDHVGICLDSGHYHAHFHDELDFTLFQDKIFCVHLHDNDGSDDQHLLPFDGTIDWEQLMKQLNKCNYTGPITMELVYRNDYLHMDVVDFFQKGYEVGNKLEQMRKNASRKPI